VKIAKTAAGGEEMREMEMVLVLMLVRAGVCTGGSGRLRATRWQATVVWATADGETTETTDGETSCRAAADWLGTTAG
jgi:hypothetical protein